jgi:hypothetical protein
MDPLCHSNLLRAMQTFSRDPERLIEYTVVGDV